jgi:hypothetical protein
MAAEPDHAAARPPDVAGGEREVHERAVGAVVVVAPDQTLLVAEHGPAPGAAFLGHGDPLGRLDDFGGVEPRDRGGVRQGHPVARERALEAREVAGTGL